jgi:hypothetical protein
VMENLQVRHISDQELQLVSYLISMTNNRPEGLIIPITVYPMNDGGMGSIRFVENEDSYIFQRDLVQADYTDEDNVPVFISLNLNTDDKLFELDIFKGDFSSLKKYPTPQDLRSIR